MVEDKHEKYLIILSLLLFLSGCQNKSIVVNKNIIEKTGPQQITNTNTVSNKEPDYK